MKSSKLACEICGRGLSEVALYRANRKGEMGRWRCKPDMELKIDSVVEEVVDAIQGNKNER